MPAPKKWTGHVATIATVIAPLPNVLALDSSLPPDYRTWMPLPDGVESLPANVCTGLQSKSAITHYQRLDSLGINSEMIDLKYIYPETERVTLNTLILDTQCQLLSDLLTVIPISDQRISILHKLIDHPVRVRSTVEALVYAYPSALLQLVSEKNYEAISCFLPCHGIKTKFLVFKPTPERIIEVKSNFGGAIPLDAATARCGAQRVEAVEGVPA